LDGEANDDEDENLDPEGDTRKYNYQDGWLAQDDHFLYEDGERDHDTLELRREIMKGTDASMVVERKICCMERGGLPFLSNKSDFEGFDRHQVGDEVELRGDAVVLFSLRDDDVEQTFDPMIVTEYIGQISKSSEKKAAKGVTKEVDPEQLFIFAKFVHRSKIPSKDQLVERFREAHPSITTSKAQAIRTLDSIAAKQRDASEGGSIWLVKETFLLSKGGISTQLKDAKKGYEANKL